MTVVINVRVSINDKQLQSNLELVEIYLCIACDKTEQKEKVKSKLVISKKRKTVLQKIVFQVRMMIVCTKRKKTGRENILHELS